MPYNELLVETPSYVVTSEQHDDDPPDIYAVHVSYQGTKAYGYRDATDLMLDTLLLEDRGRLFEDLELGGDDAVIAWLAELGYNPRLDPAPTRKPKSDPTGYKIKLD